MKPSQRALLVLALLIALCSATGERTLSAAGHTTLYMPVVSPHPAPALDPVAAIERRVGELINAARAAHGLPPLAYSVELAAAARRHSADMAMHSFFEHVGSDGSTPGTRVEAAGYAWCACGENIAAGHPTPESVVDAWLASDGHRAAILSTTYQDMGIGYVYSATSSYRHYYTAEFATSR